MLKNSFFSIVNNLVNLSVSIFSGMIIAKTLGPEGKGVFFLISQMVTLGAVFFAMGVGPSMLYYLKKGKVTKSEAVTLSTLYSFIVIVVLSILYVLFRDFFIEYLKGTLNERMVLTIFILIVLNLVTNFFGFIVMNDEKGVKIWSIVSSLGNITYLTFLFFLVYRYSEGVMGGVYALIIAVVIKVLILSRYIFLPKVSFEIASLVKIKRVVIYALGIFVGNLFLTGVYRIDIFFVNNILSVKELGLYSASVNISELLLLVPSAIGVALFPHLSGLEKKEQSVVMCKIGRLSFIIGVTGALGLILIAYPFILIVFGEKFKASFIPTLILLPGLVAMTLNFTYSNYLNSIGKPFVAAKIFTIGIVINVIMNSFFLKSMGIKGAALFSSLTYVVITLGFMYVILKENKDIKPKDIILPNTEDYKYLLGRIKKIKLA